ncbi:MAG: GNAT family N-acetyltransferase [Candidatus Bipolaricaulia bacterium]
MKLRPYREEDLPKLVDLWNEARRGSYEFIPYTGEKLRKKLERAASVLVALDEQGKIAGFALLRREWYGEELLVLARPGGQEIEPPTLSLGGEEQLLMAIERRAQTDELTVVIDAEDRERIEFFTARGYQLGGSLYQMLIELDLPRSMPPVPQGYHLRGLRPDEEEALIRVVNTAYDGERLRPGVLARWKEEDPAFSPEWVQVAEHEGQLVAAAVARTDREFNLHYHAKRGYLGPAATLPDHRGRGLNRALTVRVLNLLQEQGLEQASLYTWSGNRTALRVLKGLSFRISHRWRLLTKSSKAGRR